MSFTMTSTVRKVSDHFEPEAALDPQQQRALRGHLEQIDFAAFAANREVLAKSLGQTDLEQFQRLAVTAAHARARWIGASVALSKKAEAPTAQEVGQIASLRSAYEELTEAYNALRRLVERGYLPYRAKP
jgi:hypothetical protein